jgi:hypothetical protein
LIVGFLLNSILQLSITGESISTTDGSMPFWSVNGVLWALISIPYLILFLANRRINCTKTARIIVMTTAFIVVLAGFFGWIVVGTSKDALSFLMVLLFPMLGIMISTIVLAITMCFNKKKNKPKPSVYALGGDFFFPDIE